MTFTTIPSASTTRTAIFALGGTARAGGGGSAGASPGRTSNAPFNYLCVCKMITTIFYDSDGNITRVNRQEVELVIPEGQLFLIDNSYVNPAEIDWRSKKSRGR